MHKLPMGNHVVTLGTAGGPKFWKNSHRNGIATAVVVEDGFYLVDCGHGVGRQLERAGLPLSKLKGIFITHLHSDHITDLNTLALFSPYAIQEPKETPIPIIGPGDRGVLPPISSRTNDEVQPVFPECPTPGTSTMFTQMMSAYAMDLNDRILDSLRLSPLDVFEACDITIPSGIGFHPNENPSPPMKPFEVFRDDQTAVTAILVEHPPMAPAFAYRFETSQGSVTISGDTTFTPNMITLAQSTDLLLHEAINFDLFESMYGGKADTTAQASLDHHYKSHTTIADAVRVAREAGVRKLALHHLGPGMDSTAQWSHLVSEFDGDFLIPDDLDVISFAVP